ncbi:hypothetical protein OIU77_024875 [Salix suchowensis]|uniref:EF-hand domain-containing protein n=1 Tax=Salix suchowensis TaxID=1278906 RepID=A0ABQ9BUD3_9ROSI|nr:hypothetical protein OIU77_024875 [Salix suchowensis]
MPILLCGDWNGSKSGHVYKFLRSQGFVSSYDIAHEYTDSYADAHRWISHRNHRGNICGVDFIWLCNPIKSREPLKKSWSEAVFGIIKCQLQKASFAEKDAFAFLKDDNHGNFITYSAFCEALRQVKFNRSFLMDSVPRRQKICGCKQTLMGTELLGMKNLRGGYGTQNAQS